MIDYLKRYYAYATWANDLACDGIAQLSEENPQRKEALRLLGHVLGAGEFWRTDRIFARHSPTNNVWQTLTLDEARTKNVDEGIHWQEYLSSISDDNLSGLITYKTMAGDRLSSSLQDILHHVANHATHHRGQIMQLVRQGGGVPKPTDFIAYSRIAP
jgi:uncharacterized damage-inducible protein DinB